MNNADLTTSSTNNNNNNNLVVVITGCSMGGIGAALAKEFALRNCIVYATSRNIDKMKELKTFNCKLLELDVTDLASIEENYHTIIEEVGKVDILINNAGCSLASPIMEAPIDSVDKVFQTNVYGVLNMVKIFGKKMVELRSGTIVNISSIAGEINVPFGGIYGASKAALNSINETLRLELLPFNVNVLLIKPGAIKSNIGNNNLLFNQEVEELSQNSLYQKIYGSILKRANISQTQATYPTEEFSQRVVDFIFNQRQPLRRKLIHYLNPIVLPINFITSSLKLLIPSLSPSLNYFQLEWSINNQLVLGGNLNKYYLSQLAPRFIKDWVAWMIFDLGNLVERK